MFRQRTSSQKPGDDLLANFRQQFPEVVAVSTESSAPVISQTTAANNPISHHTTSKDCGSNTDHEPFRDQDPTPRASHEPWRFTPSLLDPNSYNFSAFGSTGPGYYTPTPGGANTLFHSQAGDLHSQNVPMVPGLGTPLSMPTSGDAIHSGAAVVDMASFQTLQPQQFHHFNPFIQPQQSQQTFAPSSFIHRDTGYETMEHDGSPMDSDPSDERMPSLATTLHSQDLTGMPMGHSLPASAEKFRFHSALNAPTAMIRHADEIPVTYLNKGQAYSLSISDTNGAIPIQPGTKYRTFVRISFEDEEQRQKPGVCWSLWKEGRGTNEAHQRGGKLQAVEFVEASQPAEGDDKRTRVELEASSFDGFSVVWTPGTNGAPEVNIAVRFNFLSTDFSHSKGVKGIPVRLCAKTSLLPADAAETTPERKLSNDVAHVKKSIDKLKQQLSQIESGIKDFGKRKRHSGASRATDPQRPGKVPKHKRTWSMSSASSAGGGGPRMTMEEDLHFKLQTLQDMFTSTRPVSVLYLRGEELDDPDLHPVSLPGDMSPPTKTVGDGLRDGPNWQARSSHSSATGSMVSPSPSSLSLASQTSAMGSGGGAWKSLDSRASGDVSRRGSERPTRISKTDEEGALSGWIEALGVDASYRPPPERTEKPVACFYVQYQAKEEAENQTYHRAIYLMKRTLEEFNGRIASKWGLEAPRIQRTIQVVRAGLEVEMDDDFVRELKEGQDMRLEVEEITRQEHATQRRWGMSADGSSDENTAKPAATKGLVLRLVT
ncbi:CP2 transcription factor domain-containing protein [Hirsutella rhossiliensis]|uniref:CP2 transcription factor domain-containing protein n=1 Tax=Hirsutella rhossiliensis TaxID=111463 RepID=A0A9P8MKJ9_9HYPO|nr:CP2 transcription factor domain-containing protein [Hirsutella rhossiliensis]KAH0958018.1 CP2 transcription factor domain-containing protein [Hirsutella rhossiliensis]